MNELSVIEYNNERVLTTQQLADSYGTDTKTISNNFNNNKSRYVEGKHYICLQGEILREFLHSSNLGLQNESKIRTLYLWTEKGTFLHAKSLNTDVAWEVYDRLMETYFTIKEKKIAMSELSPQLQLMNMLVESMNKNELEQKRLAKEQEKQSEQIKKIEQKQLAISETFQRVNNFEDFQEWVNKCIARIAESSSFDKGSVRTEKYAMARAESYERLNQKRPCRLEQRVREAKGRALENDPTIKKYDLNKINKLYVISHDKDLKTAYELVLKEMVVYYCSDVA